MPTSAIFASAPASLRERSPSAVSASSVAALRQRSPSAIFSGEVAGIPESALSDTWEHLLDFAPEAALSDAPSHLVDLIPTSAMSDAVETDLGFKPGSSLSPGDDAPIDTIPGGSLGPGDDDLTEAFLMGIRAKQMTAGTFTSAEVTRTFASGAIPTGAIADASIDENKLAAGAFDASLVGGGGTQVGLETNTDNFAPTFTGAGSWTFPVNTLQITGTPDSVNDVVNKNYVDNQVAGITWKEPVCATELLGNVVTTGLIGNTTIAGLNGLTPAAGDAYVVTDAGTPTAGTSDALVAGSLAEFDGTSWIELLTGSGGFVPAGVAALSTTTALIAPYTDVTDDGKLATFDGTGLTGTLVTPVAADAVVVSAGTDAGDLQEWSGTAWVTTLANSGGFVPNGTRAIIGTGATTIFSPYTDATDNGKIVSFNGASNTGTDTGEATDGNAALVDCENSVNENQAYVFDGAVPTGTWIQFSGGGLINAGTGLTKSGNTLNVGDINRGVQANADSLEIDGSEIAGNGLAENVTNSWQLDVDPAQLISGGNAEINGDLLDVDGITYNNITPVTSATGSQVNPASLTDHLAAHLIGIDNAISAAGGTAQQEQVTTQNITGTDTALTDTLNNTPTSAIAVKLFLNGVLLTQGAGADYTVSGTTITWLASSGTAPDLDTADVLIAVYES